MTSQMRSDDLLKGLSVGRLYLHDRLQNNNEDPQLFGSIQYLLPRVREQIGVIVFQKGVEEYRTMRAIDDHRQSMSYISYEITQNNLSYALEVNDNYLIANTIKALDCLIGFAPDSNEILSRDVIGSIRNEYGSFLVGDTGLTLLDEYLIFIEANKTHLANPFSGFNIEELLAMVALVMLFKSFLESGIDKKSRLSRCALLAVLGGFRYISVDPEKVKELEQRNEELEKENYRNTKNMKNARDESIKVRVSRGEKNKKILIFWAVSLLEKNKHLQKGDIVPVDKGDKKFQAYIKLCQDQSAEPYSLDSAKQNLKGVPKLYRDFVEENPNCNNDQAVDYILTKLKIKKLDSYSLRY